MPPGRQYLLRIVSSLLIMSLAACSSLPELPVTDESYQNWAAYQEQLHDIKSWEIHARSVIFVDKEVYQVGISWQRDIDQFVIVIEAPFGPGVFRLETNLQADGLPPIQLSMPDGRVLYDESSEALLLQELGWAIPLKGLRSWVKGLPLPGTEHSFELRASGRLKSLRQQGWEISYLDYFDEDTAAQGLPRKMYLEHQNLALKIVIERWRQFESPVSSPLIFPDFN
jgi:outer membrane lipoprotein LolB